VNTPGRRISAALPVACLSALLFWYCRSAVCEGDGDQIARFIEAGIWFVKTEILSQFLFQITYRVVDSWHWDGLMVMNLVSSVAGGVLVYFFLRIGDELADRWTAAALVFCSGFIHLAAGHTEYYPQLLGALAAWNWSCIRVLRARGSLLAPSLLFSLCVWIHQEALFALPAHLLVAFFRRDPEEWVSWTLGLVPLGILLICRFLPQVSPIRLEGMSHGLNTVPLWTTEGTEKLYTLFEWAHWRDVFYALLRRSMIAWPIILLGLLFGRSVPSMRQLKGFLVVQCAGFWILAVLWHPNLGIEADWDLYAVEAIPSTLLALVYLPALFERRSLFAVVVCLTLFSGLVTWESVLDRAKLGSRGTGEVRVEVPASDDLLITLDGHQKGRMIYSVQQGRHSLRLIDPRERWACAFHLVVGPDTTLRVPVDARSK